MYSETTTALKTIAMGDAIRGITYGNSISNIYFQESQILLLINHSTASYSLLLNPKTDEEKRSRELEVVSRLVELVSYLNKLEEEKLVYVVNEETSGIETLGVNSRIEKNGNLVNEYILENGGTLRYDKGRWYVEKDSVELMSSLREDNSLYSELSRYLCSRLYPTSALAEYIDGGYKNSDQRQAAEANRLSKRSIRLAWIAAIVSPFASLLLGNCYGISTLDSDQYNTIISTMKDKSETVQASVEPMPADSSVQGPTIQEKTLIRNVADSAK